MFLDIGIGVLVSIFISKFFGVDLSYQLVLIGVGFSLMPDLDVFVELAKRGRVGGRVQGHHRELTHFPITFIPLGFIIYFYFGVIWAKLFFLCVFSHFLHDSAGMGWGIKWLWPFSNRAYKFFSEKDGSFSSRFVVSWNPQELTQTVAQYGDDHWFRNYYLKPHPIAIFELLFFIVSLMVLYIFK